MEAEMRAILIAAVEEPGDNKNIVESLVYGFVALGGVDLDLPSRSESPRAANFAS
jgi:plasmid stability protein